MWAKKFMDTEKYLFKGEGNDYYMLVPRDMTQAMESCLVVLRKGEEVPPHSHPEEQVYFIIRGEGVFRIGDEETKIAPEMVVYIPGNEPHQVRPTSDELVYAYVQVWKGGVPEDKLDWRTIYGVK
jgi:mannose-6-phosphate isomerase-like protein (cupin superfamily)